MTIQSLFMDSDFRLSIIIPTLNERNNIRKRLEFFAKHADLAQLEVIVVDANSSDGTQDVVSEFSFAKLISSTIASRPVQMNLGANLAQFNWLYFLHADVAIPDSFLEDIQCASITHSIGGYRYAFDSPKLLLKVNAFFTRFPMIWCRGGDQTMFVKRSLFDDLDGFDEHFSVMEDFDFIRRAKSHTEYLIMPKNVVVSARKYQENGYWKVQFVNFKAFQMFRKGVVPDDIRIFYKNALRLKNY